MGVLEVIAGEEEPEPGMQMVNPHGTVGVIGEYSRGRITGLQAGDALGLTGDTRVEFSAWIGGFPRVDPSGNPVNRQKAHDVFNVLEQGGMSVAAAKTELDWP